MAKKLKIEDIPDGFSYAAVDADGSGYAFVRKPDLFGRVWGCDTRYTFLGRFDNSNWQDSLVDREAEQKPEPKKLTAADIPEGYDYAVINFNGTAFATKGKPIKYNYGWDIVGTLPFVELEGNYDTKEWSKSLVSRETDERYGLKKLTLADIPEGYNFAAIDSDGQTYVYTQKPTLGKNTWHSLGGNFKFFSLQFDASDWQNSLVSRETEPAYKETNNKLSYSEIDPYFLEAMARRMNEGKRKYGPNNWKKLSDINELLDAAQRHLLELRKMMEEDFEPLPGQETDLQHCAALACNAMFIHYHLNPNT